MHRVRRKREGHTLCSRTLFSLLTPTDGHHLCLQSALASRDS